MSAINNRINQMRLRRGLTLLEIANGLNVKEATVQRYESGKIKNIKYDTISKLSKILNCSPAYLVGWEDDPIEVIFTEKRPVYFSKEEREIIKKYRALDERGKLTIDSALETQYKITETPTT